MALQEVISDLETYLEIEEKDPIGRLNNWILDESEHYEGSRDVIKLNGDNRREITTYESRGMSISSSRVFQQFGRTTLDQHTCEAYLVIRKDNEVLFETNYKGLVVDHQNIIRNLLAR